jgi:RNA polymerase subunit RPABC4/transcription elongation factor Spt4
MKYCFNCNRITPGEPLFCNVCGSSYDWKLCPRRHKNPRTAEACSQCGSRDLSTPQPRHPIWVTPLGFLVSVVPGVFLTIASVIVLLAAIIAVLKQPGMIVVLILLAIPFGILWAMWTELPAWFRTWVYRLLKRRREQHDDGGE